MQVAKLVDDYGMVSFTPMDVSDEDRCETNTLLSVENTASDRFFVSFLITC